MGRKSETTGRAGPTPLPVLGIDVGGVLVDRVAHDNDTSFFGSRPNETPMVPGAFDAVERLAAGPFEHRVHIVSKAGPRISELTLLWLFHRGFFDLTGVSPANVHFVRQRPDKAPICAELGVTHFVDDRLDVLQALHTVRRRYLFLGGLGGAAPPDRVPRDVQRVANWSELVHKVEKSLR